MTELLHVLLIEDNPGDSRLLQELLREGKTVNFDVQRVDRLSSGLERLTNYVFDVILLDIGLPDSAGLDSLIAVRRFMPDVTVIVLTGHDDENFGLQATLAGAQDYLVKGQISSQLLIRSIRYSIERKHFETKLEYLATHDGLTGLPNRHLFDFTLHKALERARREQHKSQDGGTVAVMLLDLDNFKVVNDSFGHIQGDSLLCVVANRLQTCLRKVDTVARMGGDEFTLVLENIKNAQDCAIAAKKVLKTLSDPIQLEGTTFRTSASIGISIYPMDGANPESLLQHADIAMYRSKKTGNAYHFYSGETI